MKPVARVSVARLGNAVRVSPPALTLATAFALRATTTPHAIAVFDGDRRVTYRTLADHAYRIATALRGRVQPGGRVGVALERSEALIATQLAVWSRGAVVVPIDPAWPAARRAAVAADAELALEIDAPWLARSHPPIQPIEDLEPREAPALALYASDSSEPKAVYVRHATVLARLSSLAAMMPWRVRDRALLRTPVTCLDAYAETYGPLLAGVTSVIAPPRLAIAYLVAALVRDDITRVLLAPSQLALVLDACPDLGAFAPHLRIVATTGEPLTDALATRFRAAVPGVRLVSIEADDDR